MSSSDYDGPRFVRSAPPDGELWPLTIGPSEDVLAATEEPNSPVIAISDVGRDEDIAPYIQGRGPTSSVWTVNDPERARIRSMWLVTGTCADNPAGRLGGLPTG